MVFTVQALFAFAKHPIPCVVSCVFLLEIDSEVFNLADQIALLSVYHGNMFTFLNAR